MCGYENSLRESYADLRAHVAAALSEADDGHAVDAICLSSYRELCTDFVSSDGARGIGDMFIEVGKLVMGPGIHCPFTREKGGFNYQSAFSVKVRSVRQGYLMCYTSFLEYAESKSGGWAASSRCGLAAGVDDVLMRGEAEITGILPVIPDDTALAGLVYRRLAMTPWLNAIAWHSVCRHIVAPPNACLGLLCGALWCAASEGVSDTHMMRMARSLRALPASRLHREWEISGHVLNVALSGGEDDWAGLYRSAERLRRPSGRCAFIRLGRALSRDVPSGLVSGACPSEPKVHKAYRRRRPSVPSAVPAKLSRRLSQCAVRARQVSGASVTGGPGERMVIHGADVSGSDSSAGANVIRSSGEVEFAFLDGRWMPIRIGSMTVSKQYRGGREVYTWNGVSV